MPLVVSNGLIISWDSPTLNKDSNITYTYPVAFNQIFCFQGHLVSSQMDNSSSTGSHQYINGAAVVLNSYNNSSCVIKRSQETGEHFFLILGA